MVQINLALREINCKVVYFGCGLGGKTTNIEVVHERATDKSRGELTSIATESDRTLFFDFMPLDIGMVSGMRVKFQLYTVPGQVYYNSTRKLVLRGADAVIFIADSQHTKRQENLDSIDNLRECLMEQGRTLDDMPHIIQFNKSDMPDRMSAELMERELNLHGAETFSAVASTGEGVCETFKAMAKTLLDRIRETVEQEDNAVSQTHCPSPRPHSKPSRRQQLSGGLPTPPNSCAPTTAARTQQRTMKRSLDTSTTGIAVTDGVAVVAAQAHPSRRINVAVNNRSTLRVKSGLLLSASRGPAVGGGGKALLVVGVLTVVAGAALALIFFLL
jgi:signal recognition particle receptor subunit beta